MRQKHFGVVEQGILKYNNFFRWQQELNSLNGFDVDFSIGKKTKYSTPPQRKYYWAVIIRMIDENLNGISTKEGREKVHQMLKFKFLQMEEVIAGVVIRYVASTEKLTAARREEYHFECREWARTERNMRIPLPNEIEITEEMYEAYKG